MQIFRVRAIFSVLPSGFNALQSLPTSSRWVERHTHVFSTCLCSRCSVAKRKHLSRPRNHGAFWEDAGDRPREARPRLVTVPDMQHPFYRYPSESRPVTRPGRNAPHEQARGREARRPRRMSRCRQVTGLPWRQLPATSPRQVRAARGCPGPQWETTMENWNAFDFP